MKNIAYISILLSAFVLLLAGCSDKDKTSPGSQVIATEYHLDADYTFTSEDEGEYKIIFDAKGLRTGDKLRLVNTGSDDVTNIALDVLSGGKAAITLPSGFISGTYHVFFLRGTTVQEAGSVTIHLEALTAPDNNVVAHRGGAAESKLPDNSIASLQYAISLGCYASECDIYITKDDSVVVCHTESSDDAVFGGKVIYESTYAELKAARKLANGESLPLLQDYLQVAMQSPFTKLWIDVKSIGSSTTEHNNISGRAGVKAAEIIRTMKGASRVEYIVGRKAVLDQCIAAVKGAWEVGYMNTQYTPEQFVKAGYDWANFDLSAAFYNDPPAIRAYKDKGIKVSVYNADTDAQMDFFIAEDMYAICTNYPEKLLKKIRK